MSDEYIIKHFLFPTFIHGHASVKLTEVAEELKTIKVDYKKLYPEEWGIWQCGRYLFNEPKP